MRSCELLPRLRSVEDRRPSHGSARAWPVGEVRWRPSAVQSGLPPCGGARPGPFTRRGGRDADVGRLCGRRRKAEELGDGGFRCAQQRGDQRRQVEVALAGGGAPGKLAEDSRWKSGERKE